MYSGLHEIFYREWSSAQADDCHFTCTARQKSLQTQADIVGHARALPKVEAAVQEFSVADILESCRFLICSTRMTTYCINSQFFIVQIPNFLEGKVWARWGVLFLSLIIFNGRSIHPVGTFQQLQQLWPPGVFLTSTAICNVLCSDWFCCFLNRLYFWLIFI